jgi:predicted ATPase
LVSCLYDLREADPDRYELIEDILRAAFPGFQKLEFPPVAAGTIAMTWKDKNFTRSLYANELSEGILRFLWLVTLLHSSGLTAVTMLDEPEISLHPELLSMLAEILREVADEKQIIVATHSDSLVGFLKPEEVIVVDVDDKGLSHFIRADSMDLDHWLQNYRLDELWGMGLIGARQ